MCFIVKTISLVHVSLLRKVNYTILAIRIRFTILIIFKNFSLKLKCENQNFVRMFRVRPEKWATGFQLSSSFLPFNFKLHTTLDPYNTTEEVELTLCDANFDWTNAQIKCLAELNLFVRTASKYDDCQLLHLPNLTLTIQVNGFVFGAVIIDRPLTYDF